MPDSSYHQSELRIALDPTHPAHLLPPELPASAVVADIGCGAGQTLIAAYPDRVSFGLDVDFDALEITRSTARNVRFVCGRAEALPWAKEQFDLVIARVSLPYTDLRRSLKEIRRVLKPGGQIWVTLHPFSLAWNQARSANYKGKIFFLYILVNSVLFHLAQMQFSLMGRYESFQTDRGVKLALERLGFTSIAIRRGRHFLVTALLGEPARGTALQRQNG